MHTPCDCKTLLGAMIKHSAQVKLEFGESDGEWLVQVTTSTGSVYMTPHAAIHNADELDIFEPELATFAGKIRHMANRALHKNVDA